MNQPACRRSDGSAYHLPEPKASKNTSRSDHLSGESASLSWLVRWRICCHAMNYMHSFIETKRSLIQTTKAQCHHAAPNDTLEIEIPEYGTINRIRLLVHLEGGVGETSFQPAGYSRPNSDCKGKKFTPPPYDPNLDYSEDWIYS